MRCLTLGGVIAALAASAACRGDQQERRARTQALAACADAIERAGTASPGEQVELVARGCSAPCVGLADWLSSRSSARLRPGVMRAAEAPTALHALIDGCHATRCEATPRSAEGAASAGAAAASGAGGAGAATRPGAAVDDAPPSTRWPALIDACGNDELALPRDQSGLASEEWLVLADVARWLERSIAAGVDDGQVPGRLEHVTEAASFTLPLPAQPALPAARFVATTRARQFVAIGASEIRTGALPVVRMRGGHLEVVAVPGAFPGQTADLDRIGRIYAQHGELIGVDPAAPPAPLILADAQLPLTRVLEVIGRLEVATAELAVAGDVTLAHPIVLERRVSQYAAPEIQVQPDGVLIRGFGDDRTADWDHVDAELDHFTAVNAPVRSLELVTGPTATVADLARLLDACVAARVSTLIFAPP